MKPSVLSSIAHFLRDKNVHVVGGAVRDRLLDRETDDLDLIFPNNREHDAQKLSTGVAKIARGRAFVMDAERGIHRIALEDGSRIDVAQWQGSSLEEDVDRRDFTVNALAVPLAEWMKPAWKKAIIDRHAGLSDLKKRRIVALSPKIFKDDPLRLLRAFRLAAELDFTLPPPTLKMIRTNRKLVRKPAPERVREELLKTFSTTRAHAALVLMEKTGLLEMFFTEAKALRSTAPGYYGKGGVLKHTLDSVKHFEEVVATLRSWFGPNHKKISAYLAETMSGYSRLAHCKWGLLLHDIGKPATAKMMGGRLRFFEHEHVGADKVPLIAKRFRWSSDETATYGKLVRNHMRPGNLATQDDVTDKAIHRFFRDLEGDAMAMLLVSLADHLTYLTPRQLKKRNSDHERVTIKMVKKFYGQREKILPPKIVNGYDIMKAFNLKPSPLIGRLMTDVVEAQTEGRIKTSEQALAYLRGRIKWHESQIPAAKPS